MTDILQKVFLLVRWQEKMQHCQSLNAGIKLLSLCVSLCWQSMFLLNKESALKSSPPLETMLLRVFSSDVTVNKSKGPSNNIRTHPHNVPTASWCYWCRWSHLGGPYNWMGQDGRQGRGAASARVECKEQLVPHHEENQGGHCRCQDEAEAPPPHRNNHVLLHRLHADTKNKWLSSRSNESMYSITLKKSVFCVTHYFLVMNPILITTTWRNISNTDEHLTTPFN